MEYTIAQKAERIINAAQAIKSTDPIFIFRTIAAQDFVSIHGPEHHILDGVCILTAYYNAGGKIVLTDALNCLMEQGLQMPGAICGQWGVCGAVTSVGAALSIIDNTGPLSTDGTWGHHMSVTSSALAQLAEINGPRCCKRDAFISLQAAIQYINMNYSVQLNSSSISCPFSSANAQCIRERCPFHVK